MNKTDLSKYDNSWYNPGSGLKRFLWYYVQLVFFKWGIFPFSGLKKFWLRLFGAKVGEGVVIKPGVQIKFPWMIKIGNYSWIGENVWIDNLGMVTIGDNVCISQGALLECGNHDYKKTTFDLVVHKIVLEDGVWIGANSTVAGNVNCRSHSVLAAGSFTSKDLEEFSVNQGNPAIKVKDRTIE